MATTFLRLARLRFVQAGLAARVHADGAEQLDWLAAVVADSSPISGTVVAVRV